MRISEATLCWRRFPVYQHQSSVANKLHGCIYWKCIIIIFLSIDIILFIFANNIVRTIKMDIDLLCTVYFKYILLLPQYLMNNPCHCFVNMKSDAIGNVIHQNVNSHGSFFYSLLINCGVGYWDLQNLKIYPTCRCLSLHYLCFCYIIQLDVTKWMLVVTKLKKKTHGRT